MPKVEISNKDREIILSIQPKYAEKIIGMVKTIELRRKRPKSIGVGSSVFIYSSSPTRAIIGKAIVQNIRELSLDYLWKTCRHAACISKRDFNKYFSGLSRGVAIHLKQVEPLQPVWHVSELSDLCGFVPPQSFSYVNTKLASLLRNERASATAGY